MKKFAVALFLCAAAAAAGDRPKGLKPEQAAEYQRLRAERMGSIAAGQARETERRAAEDAVLAAQARLQAAQRALAEAYATAERADAALRKFETDLSGESGCTLTPAGAWDCSKTGEPEGGAAEKR